MYAHKALISYDFGCIFWFSHVFYDFRKLFSNCACVLWFSQLFRCSASNLRKARHFSGISQSFYEKLKIFSVPFPWVVQDNLVHKIKRIKLVSKKMLFYSCMRIKRSFLMISDVYFDFRMYFMIFASSLVIVHVFYDFRKHFRNWSSVVGFL